MSLADIVKAAGAVAKRYAPREEIFAHGTPSDDGVCLVLQGTVEVFSSGRQRHDARDRGTQPRFVFRAFGPAGYTTL
jgi:CRP-like cAMP-binding protein